MNISYIKLDVTYRNKNYTENYQKYVFLWTKNEIFPITSKSLWLKVLQGILYRPYKKLPLHLLIIYGLEVEASIDLYTNRFINNNTKQWPERTNVVKAIPL